jgi:hypothetical protein
MVLGSNGAEITCNTFSFLNTQGDDQDPLLNRRSRERVCAHSSRGSLPGRRVSPDLSDARQAGGLPLRAGAAGLNSNSVPNPLHVFEQNLLSAPVIELGCPAVDVSGYSLSGFKSAVIFQKIRDAGRPERVRRIVRRQPRLFKPSFEHVRGIGAHKRLARQLAGLSDRGRE